MRVWGEEVVTSCCHRFRRGEFPIEERLVGRTTLRAVSMMGTLAIVEGQIGIEIAPKMPLCGAALVTDDEVRRLPASQ